jgi:hypothetical protein
VPVPVPVLRPVPVVRPLLAQTPFSFVGRQAKVVQ